MQGCPLPGGYSARIVLETAMGTQYRVARIGMDIPRTFSQVTARDDRAAGRGVVMLVR